MGVGRRQVLLGGLGLGLAATAAGPRGSSAREDSELGAFSTYGIVPAGGELDQTATLQLAADQAAETGTPLFLPAGIYSTSRLTLEIRHPDRRRAGTVDPALSRRRRAAEPRRRGECAAGRPGARRRRQAARRRRRAARRDRGEASRSRRLPLRQQHRERRALEQSVGLDQGLRDRRHRQSRPVQRRRRRPRDRA